MKTHSLLVRGSVALSLIAVALCVLLPLRARQSSPTVPLMVAGKDGFLLMPPQMVSNGGQSSVVPAPGGRYALVAQVKGDIAAEDLLLNPTDAQRNSKTGESQLILWDSRKMQSRTIWRGKFSETDGSVIQGVEWFPGTSRALVTIANTSNRNGMVFSLFTYHLMNAAVGSFSSIPALAPPKNGKGWEDHDVNLHPSLPYAVVGTIIRREETNAASPPNATDTNGNPLYASNVSIVREDGTAKAITFPAGSMWLFPFWSSDPNTMYVHQVKTTGRDEKNAKIREQTYYSVNLKTAVVTKLAEKPKDMVASFDEEKFGALKPKTDPLPVALQNITVPLASAKTADDKAAATTPKTLDLLYLKSVAEPLPNEADRVLLAAEAKPVGLMPDASAAFYTLRGNLFVAPLVRVDSLTLLTMRQKAQRMQTLTNAKMIGLGLIMYAQDYDENLPSDPDAVKDTVSPYIKNADVFNNPATGKPGFAYTYTGATDFKNIDKPAETKIGYVSGPGGRAIIYADGHVKWEPEPR